MASNSLLSDVHVDKLSANRVLANKVKINQLNVKEILNADDINMNRNIGWIITMTLKEGVKMEHVADLVRPLIDMVRTESGCLVYDFAAAANDDKTVILTEEYVNIKAVQEHFDNLGKTGNGANIIDNFDIGVAISYTPLPEEVRPFVLSLVPLAHAVLVSKEDNLIAR